MGADRPFAPQHAAVAPAVLVQMMKQPLPSRLGPVEPGELLDWLRPQALNEDDKVEIVRVVLNRLRATRRLDPALLWPGIELSAGWRPAGQVPDAERVQQVLQQSPSGTADFTLQDWKTCTRLPLARLVRLLAALEADGWSGITTARTAIGGNLEAAAGADIERPASVVQMAPADLMRAGGLPWLQSVKADDLRIRVPDGADPGDWLKRESHKAHPSRIACKAAADILTADACTFAQEVADVAQAAAGVRSARRGGRSGAHRWVSIFVARHVSPEGPGRTLAEVGDMFDLTRERIRQVCEKLLEQVREGSVALPATMRVLEIAKRVAPANINDINEQLRPYLGEGAGIEAAVAFAQEMGVAKLPVEVDSTPLRVGGDFSRVSTIKATDDFSWSAAAFRFAKRDLAFIGCTSVQRLAGSLALELGIAQPRENLLSLMEAAPGFQLLDAEGGWFTFADGGSNSAAAGRIRKMMAVAKEPVSVDAIAAALITDDTWMIRDKSHESSLPALHILRDMMYGWSWLEHRQHNRFNAREPVPLDVLTDSERVAVEVIEAHGGIATRLQLSDAIIERLGVTQIAVSVMLGSSPVIVKVEHGLYALVARRVANSALAQARARLRGSITGVVDDNDASAHGFRLLVTEASLKHEQYTVPARFADHFPTGRLDLLDGQGTLWVGASGVLRRLKRVFPESRPGDAYWVEVRPQGVALI